MNLKFFFLCLVVFTINISCKRPLLNSARKQAEKRIVIIVASYNNKEWYQTNLKSLFFQKYNNYHIMYIDDCSPDETEILVEQFIQENNKQNKITLIKNKVRQGALANIYHAVHQCNDDDIIVLVDGDDWLCGRNVLSKLNLIYQSPDIWLTHGTFIEYSGLKTNFSNVWPTHGSFNQRIRWCQPMPTIAIKQNTFRSYRCASHLRTFYAWLFKKIRIEDLMYEGKFFEMTWDQAIMFPMLEMAAERHIFISEILYVYNVKNSINDNKVNAQLQRDLEHVIRAMPPYQRLTSAP